MKVGAPALVVLATVVNVAASSDAIHAPLENAYHTPVSWSAEVCVRHSAQSARVLIARKAATTIRCLDWLFGATLGYTVSLEKSVPAENLAGGNGLTWANLVIDSTSQHSAP